MGHAVEACSGFTLLHGQAVAIGIAVILRAAAARGFCTGETAREGIALLKQYGLPTETDYPLDALYQAAVPYLGTETLPIKIPLVGITIKVGRRELDSLYAYIREGCQ